eukprot:3437741-Rhodomonas_salina.5
MQDPEMGNGHICAVERSLAPSEFIPNNPEIWTGVEVEWRSAEKVPCAHKAREGKEQQPEARRPFGKRCRHWFCSEEDANGLCVCHPESEKRGSELSVKSASISDRPLQHSVYISFTPTLIPASHSRTPDTPFCWNCTTVR